MAVLILSITVGGSALAADGKGYTIGFATHHTSNNNYCTLYFETYNELIKTKYPDSNFILMDAKSDVSEQINQIDNLIAQDVDVMIIWPVNSEALTASVQAVHDAGIPIVVTNTPLTDESMELVVCYTGPNSYDEAVMAAEMMIEGLGEKGGKVVECSGTAGFRTSIERHQGFVDTIAKADNVEMLDSQPCDWSAEKARELVQTYLATYGDEIAGIYFCDDGAAQGGRAALEAAGKDDGSIIITSATLFGSGWDAIKAGKMYGSVYQSPIYDATICIDTAIAVASGETVNKDETFETFKVTAENVDEFERPTW